MTCSIEGCPNQRWARGWCNAHYKRWRKHGDPLKVAKRKQPTHCQLGHRLAGKNVRIRVRDGRKLRVCVLCHNRRQREWHRQARAEGKVVGASAEYHRRRRAEIKAGVRTVNKRRIKPTYTRVQPLVLDLLDIEGTWWTMNQIAWRLNRDRASVHKALNRLTEAGLLITRPNPRGKEHQWKIGT